MMQALKDLLGSAHGLLVIILLVATAVFVVAGKMTTDQWSSYSQWLFATFMGGHAVMAVGESIANKGNSAPPEAK